MGFFSKLFGSQAANPTRPLHELIQLARQRSIPIDEMLGHLVAGTVYVPLEGPPNMEGKEIKSWKPATVSKADRSQWLVAFTSPELASPFCRENRQFSHGFGVATSWVLGALPPGHGIVINIGSDSHFEWNADGIAQYVASRKSAF